MCREINQSRRRMLQLIFQLGEFSSTELKTSYREACGEEVRLGATETIASYLQSLVQGGVLSAAGERYSVTRDTA